MTCAHISRNKKKVIILGNCVAERLQGMLARCPGFAQAYSLERAPMIHSLTLGENLAELTDLARKALACDIIFTQPLFNYGPCNTEALKAALREGQELKVFASPNFPAYFPDVTFLRRRGPFSVPPMLDWDSSIIFSCYVAGVPIFELEDIYLNHALFHEGPVRQALVSSLEAYAKREQGLDLPTGAFFFKQHARQRLLHSPQHPTDNFLLLMLGLMTDALNLPRPDASFDIDGFGFNSWPLITRHHSHFSFAEEAFFVIAGKTFRIEDVAMAYYNFYSFHPHVVDENMDKVISL